MFSNRLKGVQFIVVWSGVSYKKCIGLVRISGNMDFAYYGDILKNALLANAICFREWTFQQDNTPVNSSTFLKTSWKLTALMCWTSSQNSMI